MTRTNPRRLKLAVVGVWSLTTVVLFSGGNTPKNDAVAQSPYPGGCPSGWFCAKFVGNTGGCSMHTCCEAGQTYCSGAEYSPYPAPKWVAATKGTCVQGSESEQTDWCLRSPCTGATYCAQGNCVPGAGETLKVAQTLEGLSCPAAVE